MEVGPQETDFDFLVRDVETAGIPIPFAPDAQTDGLHHLAGLGVFRAVPVSPQLSVVDEPGAAAWHHVMIYQPVDLRGGGGSKHVFSIRERLLGRTHRSLR